MDEEQKMETGVIDAPEGPLPSETAKGGEKAAKGKKLREKIEDWVHIFWMCISSIAWIGALVLLGLALWALLADSSEEAEMSVAPLSEGAYIMTVPTADLSAAASAGDLIQVFSQQEDKNGSAYYSPVSSLQYVEVCALTNTSISVYMTQAQLLDYLAVQDRCAVALAVQGGTEEAAEKLAWQAHFNDPTVKLTLSEATKTVAKGAKAQLELQIVVEPEEADPGEVSWESSNEAVATVDENGMVTAVDAGTAEISASCGEVTVKCTVTVYLTATEITVQEQAVIGVNGTVQLEAAVQPEGLGDPISWTSSNEDVATVDENGVVTGVGIGSAEILAVCGDVSAICQVSVEILAEEIHLTPDSLALTVGQTATLQAQVGPDNTTDKTIVWTSSNEAVATVAENGTVTAVAAGTAEITATCGEITATCTVTVQ